MMMFHCYVSLLEGTFQVISYSNEVCPGEFLLGAAENVEKNIKTSGV